MNKLRNWGTIHPNKRKPTLSELGIGMTVCIAASCEEYQATPKVVLASDKMLSFGVTSTDRLKARRFGNNWGIMFAGDDVSFAEQVIYAAVASAQAQDHDLSYHQATQALVKSYQKTRQTQIEQLFLATYGWDIQTFMKLGPEVPTVAHREYLLNEMERFDLGCEFLVAGFHSPTSQSADIFQVQNPGRLVPQSITGYAAIGSGSTAAISYLATREQSGYDRFAETVYNVIAAKRLAERAIGVGRETVVIILERGKKEIDWLNQDAISSITKISVEEESEIRPRNLIERVGEILTPPARLQKSSPDVRE
jgi:20S proteasome alpha/beta subunit